MYALIAPKDRMVFTRLFEVIQTVVKAFAILYKSNDYSNLKVVIDKQKGDNPNNLIHFKDISNFDKEHYVQGNFKEHYFIYVYYLNYETYAGKFDTGHILLLGSLCLTNNCRVPCNNF